MPHSLCFPAISWLHFPWLIKSWGAWAVFLALIFFKYKFYAHTFYDHMQSLASKDGDDSQVYPPTQTSLLNFRCTFLNFLTNISSRKPIDISNITQSKIYDIYYSLYPAFSSWRLPHLKWWQTYSSAFSSQNLWNHPSVNLAIPSYFTANPSENPICSTFKINSELHFVCEFLLLCMWQPRCLPRASSWQFLSFNLGIFKIIEKLRELMNKRAWCGCETVIAF